MKHLALALVIAALALPASAFGKGPSAASVDGPGVGGGITFSGDGESGGTTPGNLANQAGLFYAAFAQEPDPMLSARPKGDLGPRYTITWTVPGPYEAWKLRQDVYPYATPAPVTYMEPGQTVYDQKTRGGWFQAGPELKTTLVDAGLPSSASTAAATSSEFPNAALFSLLAGFLLVALTAAVVVRRRTRPAAA
jgi:hypothetical protein